jgi:hypothetical protein
MGFLDGSTNNIILDTVLTDVGRQLLAKNDGSFAIAKFAFGDDEVDYTVIKRYGRSVGKEKIEKNTPIFEGITSAGNALKYKMISVSNPNLVRLPSLSLSGDSNVSSSTSIVSLGSVRKLTASITCEQTIINEPTIDPELRDQVFIVELSNIFLQILRQTPDSIDAQQRATYILSRSPTENSYQGSILQFALSVKSITDAQFTIYGTTADKNVIATYVRVTGAQSGAVSEFRVNIRKGD